jgi:5-methylphenazine-1-carboxylate 1-monooxygenase
VAALKEYEDRRLAPTAKVVRTNRENPPDAILREVYLRTGDKPFTDIEQVIPRTELTALSDGYKAITGQQREAGA